MSVLHVVEEKRKDKVQKGDYKWIVILAIVAISANINQDQASLHIWTDYLMFWILIPCLVHSTENGDSHRFSRKSYVYGYLAWSCLLQQLKRKVVACQVWSLMKEDLLSVFVSCKLLSTKHLLLAPAAPCHIPWASCHLTGLDLQLTNQKSTVKQSEHTCRLAGEKWYGKGRGGVQLRGCILSRRRENCWMV